LRFQSIIFFRDILCLRLCEHSRCHIMLIVQASYLYYHLLYTISPLYTEFHLFAKINTMSIDLTIRELSLDSYTFCLSSMDLDGPEYSTDAQTTPVVCQVPQWLYQAAMALKNQLENFKQLTTEPDLRSRDLEHVFPQLARNQNYLVATRYPALREEIEACIVYVNVVWSGASGFLYTPTKIDRENRKPVTTVTASAETQGEPTWLSTHSSTAPQYPFLNTLNQLVVFWGSSVAGTLQTN
jgi:hypothetical protein